MVQPEGCSLEGLLCCGVELVLWEQDFQVDSVSAIELYDVPSSL